MAILPELQSPVAAAIERHYESQIRTFDGPALTCGKIGEQCERSLWYAFRWATPPEVHNGRKERLFKTGHREEARMIEDLKAIGITVWDRDPETGKQFRVSYRRILNGKTDGVGINVPGAEKTPHLLECKTHNDKSFNDWRKHGVEKSKPEHYAQMQIYMDQLGLDRALYICHNKNDDTVETERVKLDPLFVAQIKAKAERIAFANKAPPKIDKYLEYMCRFCRHHDTCQDGAPARRNCRTCLHSELTVEGEWRCGKDGQALTLEQQAAGCKAHLYLPSLVAGEQVDADEDAGTVTYRMPDGSTFIDGASA